MNVETEQEDQQVTEKKQSPGSNEAPKGQDELLDKITKIYKSDKYDATKKVMLFTSEVCIPEIMKQQKLEEQKALSGDQSPEDAQNVYLSLSNDKDQEIIPFVCFYNGLSFLKRLPTKEEVAD